MFPFKQILSERGYRLQPRGLVQVKGKGEMQTYLVVGKEMGSPKGVHRQPSSRSSLAAVVYGMVRARRRQTTAKQGKIKGNNELTSNRNFVTRFSLYRQIIHLGVLTSAAAVQQLHRTSTRRAAATSSSSASAAQGALDRLRAFSSVRRQPTLRNSTNSSGVNQNGSGNPGHPSPSNNIRQQNSESSPSKLRQATVGQDPNLTIPNRSTTISSRHPLQISRSYHDMPKFNTVQEHIDDNDDSDLPYGEVQDTCLQPQ